MNKNEINNIKEILNMYIVGKMFKVSELFDPVVWENKTISEKNQIGKEFYEEVTTNLKEFVEIAIDDQSDLLKVYRKIKNGLIKEKVNVFPDKPVTVKRNERGNA